MAKNLSSYLRKATVGHWAIPHFNVSNLEQLRGIVDAAAELRAPVMIGTSEHEREIFEPEAAAVLVETYAERFGVPLFINADHTHSVELAKRAVDAGYHSVHIDLSKLPYAENLKGAAEVVRYARRSGREVSVEGELGNIPTDSSTVIKGKVKIDRAGFTSPEQALEYCRLTGIDRLAPAVGNYHGMSAETKKRLDFKLIAELRGELKKDIALVLHGGSGSGDAAFKKAIAAGIANVHISTELRLAFSECLRETLRAMPDEVVPYKLTEPAREAVRQKARHFIKLFGAAGRA